MRSFSLLKDGEKVGRYMSKTPISAARKAFNKHFKSGEHIFSIQETTKNSKKKIFKYKGSVKNVNKSYKVKNKNGENKTINIKKEVSIKSFKN